MAELAPGNRNKRTLTKKLPIFSSHKIQKERSYLINIHILLLFITRPNGHSPTGTFPIIKFPSHFFFALDSTHFNWKIKMLHHISRNINKKNDKIDLTTVVLFYRK